MTLKQHKLSAAFPPLPIEDLQELSLSIQKSGLLTPGTLLDGEVLDGWHRYQACMMADVEFVAHEYAGDDPVAFVIAANLHRRQLTASQRAAAVVMVMEWQKVGRPSQPVAAQGSNKSGTFAPFTTAQMAAVASVGERTIKHAKAAVKAGHGEDVVSGTISAKQAANESEPVDNVVMDEEGQEIPPALVAQWRRRDAHKKILSACSLIRSTVRDAITQTDNMWVELTDIKSTERLLDSLWVQLNLAMPYAVCPTCRGVEEQCEGCPNCSGRGFVSKFRWKQTKDV